MTLRISHLVCAALIACIPCLARCAPRETPAAPVPSHVLTREQAGSLSLAEQGDVIEVRLLEPSSTGGTWRVLRQSGSAYAAPLGPATLARDQHGTQRVFRFRAQRIGMLELVFVLQTPNKTPRPDAVVAFKFAIK